MSGPMEQILRLESISRRFKLKNGVFSSDASLFYAVRDVSLVLKDGQTCGLVGESGCGKSTTARMAAGLLEPSSGSVFVCGKDRYSKTQRSKFDPRMVQMVFQDPFSSLNPRMRIGKALEEPLRIACASDGCHASQNELRSAAEKMLEQVGLSPLHYARYPHEFSGGQRQRIAIARALITSPRLLICDEPVSALDASVQAQILNLLKDMRSDSGSACLFISHNLNVVGYMCDFAAVMYFGRIMEQADTDTLFGHPAHPYTRALVEAAPQPDSDAPARALIVGEPPDPANPPSGCPFRPRCPESFSRCSVHCPEETEIAPGHVVRCHLYSRRS
ncbi:MAG: ABC transporter ATP-binding protein [Mailhella sp.]|nr:ABC transporter ATP-binding protein [Mailhella sp.]